jgi:hypothetical protein
MRYSLLLAFGLAALGLASSSAYALDSCYQICKPTVSCNTPCIDPYRPYAGPLACGAGFSCARSRHDGASNAGLIFSALKNDPAAGKNEPQEGQLCPAAPSVQKQRRR